MPLLVPHLPEVVQEQKHVVHSEPDRQVRQHLQHQVRVLKTHRRHKAVRRKGRQRHNEQEVHRRHRRQVVHWALQVNLPEDHREHKGVSRQNKPELSTAQLLHNRLVEVRRNHNDLCPGVRRIVVVRRLEVLQQLLLQLIVPAPQVLNKEVAQRRPPQRQSIRRVHRKHPVQSRRTNHVHLLRWVPWAAQLLRALQTPQGRYLHKPHSLRPVLAPAVLHHPRLVDRTDLRVRQVLVARPVPVVVHYRPPCPEDHVQYHHRPLQPLDLRRVHLRPPPCTHILQLPRSFEETVQHRRLHARLVPRVQLIEHRVPRRPQAVVFVRQRLRPASIRPLHLHRHLPHPLRQPVERL
eukprot:Hpha_TRINITY_DN16820_c6_g4::TRINITY_DN16820_c6_g4_i2::g.151481::m.151481